MEHWAFLLQKEGDRSWLPLDSPEVEILEGRYRVVVRSSQINTKIDSRISHLATEETPPKQRTQRRSGQTNADGLMVLIPFTTLEAGIWELQCSSGDPMSDLLGESWRRSVQLHVQPYASDPEDWEPDWSNSDSIAAESTLVTSGPSLIAVAPLHPVVEALHPVEAAEPEAAIETVAAIQPDAAPDATVEAALEDSVPSIAAPAAMDSAQTLQSPPESEAVRSPDAAMQQFMQQTEELSEQLLDDVLRDFDFAIAQDLEATPAFEPAKGQPSQTPSEQQPFDSVFAIQLDHEALVACQGDVLSLSGLVRVPTAAAAQSVGEAELASTSNDRSLADSREEVAATDETAIAVQELQLCLRDPQSSRILISDCQILSQLSADYAFSFQFTLPADLDTRLVLGELLLCGNGSSSAETPIVLATQTFSITVNPTQLVEELTRLNEVLVEDPAETADVELPSVLASRAAGEETQLSLNLSFLHWEETAAVKPFSLSLAGQPLPPQIYHPDPAQPRNKPLDLPSFAPEPPPEIEAASVAEQETESDLDSAPTPTIATADTSENSEAAISVASDLQPTAADLEIAQSESVQEQPELAAPSLDIEPDEAPVETVATAEPLAEDTDSPIHTAFQALKLQDRFLSRLSSFAASTTATGRSQAGRSPLTSGSELAPLEEMTQTSLSPDCERLAQEVVVDDDEPLPPSRRRRSLQANRALLDAAAPEAPNSLLLSEDEAVPRPDLQVAAGELVAGQPVNIWVKLPDGMPRIYVKLWVTDRQTRSLLDGPRWLVDFLPNGHGALEAMTQITVPFGSLEIGFEAIAIEMHTQRESCKVTVSRTVIPPDLPIVLLDMFDARF